MSQDDDDFEIIDLTGIFSEAPPPATYGASTSALPGAGASLPDAGAGPSAAAVKPERKPAVPRRRGTSAPANHSGASTPQAASAAAHGAVPSHGEAAGAQEPAAEGVADPDGDDDCIVTAFHEGFNPMRDAPHNRPMVRPAALLRPDAPYCSSAVSRCLSMSCGKALA